MAILPEWLFSGGPTNGLFADRWAPVAESVNAGTAPDGGAMFVPWSGVNPVNVPAIQAPFAYDQPMAAQPGPVAPANASAPMPGMAPRASDPMGALSAYNQAPIMGAAPEPGLWDRIGGGLARNSNMLIGLGGDIMSNGFRGGLRGALAGAALDKKQVDSTDLIKNYTYARQQGYPGTFEDFIAEQRAPKGRRTAEVNGRLIDVETGEVIADYSGDKPPVTIENDPDKPRLQWNPQSRQFEPLPGGPSAQTNPYSVGGNVEESKAQGFANRLFAAEKILRDPEIIDQQKNLRQQGFEQVPGVGNYLTSGAKQRATRAEKDFVTAVLRRESGATIREEEFENETKKYFPRPGDSEAVLRDKRLARIEAIKAMAAGAGRRYKPPYSFNEDGSIPGHDDGNSFVTMPSRNRIREIKR